MAEDPAPTQSQVVSLPVEEILLNTAHSVLEAQRVLDAFSLEQEVRIRQEGLDKLGLAASWYSIPELTFELKLAFELGNRGELKTQMVDAEYQSRYGFNLKASSLLKTRIVATPATEPAGLSLRQTREVLQRVGQLKKVVETYDAADTPRFEVRYRPFVTSGYAGGLWYVWLVDTASTGEVAVRALIVVDDASGEVLRLWTKEVMPPDDDQPARSGYPLPASHRGRRARSGLAPSASAAAAFPTVPDSPPTPAECVSADEVRTPARWARWRRPAAASARPEPCWTWGAIR